MNFSQFKALTFDCYGTLIDWETGILSVLRPWAARNALTVADDGLLSAFARYEPVCERNTPGSIYPDVLRNVYRKIAEEFGVAAIPDDADALAQSVGDWPAFTDTPAALKTLQSRFKLVIVSNVDRASFERTNQKLGITFDAIVTAEEVGAYKPDHRMFERAHQTIESTGIHKNEILHVAQSLYHDHVPAKELGMTTLWVDRRGGKEGGATLPPDSPVTPDFTVVSMADAAKLLCGEAAN